MLPEKPDEGVELRDSVLERSTAHRPPFNQEHGMSLLSGHEEVQIKCHMPDGLIMDLGSEVISIWGINKGQDGVLPPPQGWSRSHPRQASSAPLRRVSCHHGLMGG